MKPACCSAFWPKAKAWEFGTRKGDAAPRVRAAGDVIMLVTLTVPSWSADPGVSWIPPLVVLAWDRVARVGRVRVVVSRSIASSLIMFVRNSCSKLRTL